MRTGGFARILCSAVPLFLTTKASAEELIHKSPFGRTASGPVDEYTLRNRQGMEARIITYGGILTVLTAPDRSGHYADIVLGHDTLEGYLHASPYFGALIGRYGNRIARGHFTLNGRTYSLAINDPPNTLHGGRVGFNNVLWRVASARVTPAGAQITLVYVSYDGEEGYPGKLSVTAVYTLTPDNALRLEFAATTDAPTVVNLTQHSYFNLRGSGDVRGHIVQIQADRFTPVDQTLIPTGELRSVNGTPFDFRTLTAIGARIDEPDAQLRFAKGYDHNFVLSGVTDGVRLNATVYEPTSGRVLEVLSDQPGIQFYTGNFLDGTIHGKGGRVYVHRGAFCLEPQQFPDSPNHPQFPSTVLRPGETYHSTIIYRFSSR